MEEKRSWCQWLSSYPHPLHWEGERERMGIYLVLVSAPHHQSLVSQPPPFISSSSAWLHGLTTTPIRYASKLTNPHCSSSTSPAVVEEGPPPDQSGSLTNDAGKLPLRYHHFFFSSLPAYPDKNVHSFTKFESFFNYLFYKGNLKQNIKVRILVLGYKYSI